MWSSAATRLLGPAGKARVGIVAEAAWSVGFSGLGIMLPRRPVQWRDLEPYPRILVVAPHPDDESIGCAGAMILHKRSGAKVTVACVTDGRSSRALGLDAGEMARRRRLEANACARLLEIDDLEWFGLPDGEWHDDDFLSRLEIVVRQHCPDIVYVPSCVDFHPEHRRVASALGRFWSQSSTKPEAVRIYSVQVPLTPTLANLVVDVSDVISQARDAMHAYTTQLANMPRAMRQRRYAACRYRLGQYVEEFCQLSADVYARLHRQGAVPDRSAFRGVREHAISDPLAYAAGWRARRRLAAQISR